MINHDKFWDKKFQEINSWRIRHPSRIIDCKNLNKELRVLHHSYMKSIQEYEYQKQEYYLFKAEKIKQQAENLFKKTSKKILITSLS